MSVPREREYQMLLASEERKYRMFDSGRNLSRIVSYHIAERGVVLRSTHVLVGLINKVYALSRVAFSQSC
jgi:hypothetical protein